MLRKPKHEWSLIAVFDLNEAKNAMTKKIEKAAVKIMEWQN